LGSQCLTCKYRHALILDCLHREKSTGQTAEATECYEAALAAQPDNEEYARELFFCYCRQCAYAKAQQLATKLYKQFALPQYLFWCVRKSAVFLLCD
jgi:hypothetical protein